MVKRKLGLSLAATLAIGTQTVFAQGLPGETQARQAADAQLQSNIDVEAAARAAAALQLQRNIDGEAGARADADSRLQSQIDQLRSSIGGGGGSVTVDCSTGGSVSAALAAGASQITVRGTCTESVEVNRDGVTLLGEQGATIRGPDLDVNTINVTGNRVTIDGLTVTGGRNGITGLGAANLALRNCSVRFTGRTGIAFSTGASGTVDGCTVDSNPRDGIVVDGAQATITNSTVTNNRNGVAVVNGGTSRIGLTDRLAPAGNTIGQNGANGVTVNAGSTATIAMNTITGNGTNPSLPGRAGIGLFLSATADIAGGNTISGNAGPGVAMSVGSTAVIGDTSFGFTTLNTISGNGTATAGGGVSAFLSASLVVRDAVIEGNTGPGIIFSTRSQGQMFSTAIRNNTGDGIRFVLGSALLPLAPASIVSGNSGFGVQCFDGESSIVNTIPSILSVFGNSAGDVAPGCTAF